MPGKQVTGQDVLQLFGQLLNEIHDAFMVVDADWNIHFANRRSCEYFNDGNPMQGKNLLETFPVYKRSDLIDQFNRVRESGRPAEFEAISPFSKRWMHFRAYPVDSKMGVYATDIHLRKEAQRAIMQNQERYLNFISQSTEGIWRCELEEPIPVSLSPQEQIDMVYEHAYMAECNDAMAKMYGFRDAYDLMGCRIEKLLPRNEENEAYLTAFIESGYKLYDAQSVELAKDGSTKYMLNNLMGIIENSHIVRAWGTQRDITHIREVEQKLQEAQTQLNLALSAGSAGTFVWNIQTNETQWTREQETLYGIAEGSFNGQLDGWMNSIHPEDLPVAMDTMQDAITEKKDVDMEYRIVKPDGKIHWILARAKIVYDANGNPEKMIGINIDVTNRKNNNR